MSAGHTSPEGRRRLPLLFLGAAALITGLWTGLARLGALGTPLPVLAHGPLMVSGFLGTVISLERAVASRQRWAYAGPLLCGAGAALLLAGLTAPGSVLLTLGSLVVVVVLTRVVFQLPALHHAVLALAALSWLVGNALLASGRQVFEVVPFWVIFLVGTIAAERLELTRVLPRSRASLVAFSVALGVMVVGALASLGSLMVGWRLLCAGAVLLGLWLARFDVARRTVKQKDLVRFIAVALLSGYAWLFVGGVLGLVFGFVPAGPHYDAVLHALFVGFVFSMIFGHAPVIVPAVLGARIPFKERFYVHFALLHASVAMRLAGDVFDLFFLRRLGAWGNALAIVLFLVSTLAAAVSTPAPTRTGPRPAPASV